MKNLSADLKLLIPIIFFVVTLPVLTLQIQNEQNIKSKASSQSMITPAGEEFTGKTIVKFKSGVDESQYSELITQIGARTERRLQENGAFTVSRANTDPSTLAEEYRQNPDVEYAFPERVIRSRFTPNDPRFSQQWGLTKIQAPQAWDITKGSTSVNIAIIDSGVTSNHPDITPKVTKWKSYYNSLYDNTSLGHGSLTAGIAAAVTNNSQGIAGTAPDVNIFSVKVLADNGNGSETDIADGIRWAADNGAHVINLSLGAPWNEVSDYGKSAVSYALSRGVVVVGAVANDPASACDWPTCNTQVVSVTATDSNDRVDDFAARGSWVHLGAPGIDIISTAPTNTYATHGGTSLAAPFVSGVAALTKSAFPSYSNAQILAKLCSSADRISGTGTNWSCGRLNAYKAVQGGSGSSPTPTPTGNATQPPGPTPTQPPGPTPTVPPIPGGGLVLKLHFQGVTKQSVSQPISLNIIGGSGSVWQDDNIQSSSDSSGAYSISVPESEVNAGTYSLYVKGNSHLAKKIDSITYNGGDQTIDLSREERYESRAGDVTGDNAISIDDVSRVARYYTDFSVSVNYSDSNMSASDINKDGFITIQDIALIAINWNDLRVEGDSQ